MRTEFSVNCAPSFRSEGEMRTDFALEGEMRTEFSLRQRNAHRVFPTRPLPTTHFRFVLSIFVKYAPGSNETYRES